VVEEDALFELIRRHAVPDPAGVRWEVGLRRHPRDLAAALRALRGLDRLACSPGPTPAGREVAAALDRRAFGLRTPVHEVTNVLETPRVPGSFGAGHEKATQRRKARQAVRLGVTWRDVPPAERPALLASSDGYERENPRRLYRNAVPETERLLDLDHWLAAYRDDRPILLSVTAVDGAFAVLSHFRTLESTDAASAARYLMTEALAETLAERGVHHLCDPVSPFRLPSGLLHFARMVGFRLARVRVVRPDDVLAAR
jgi:hypothetical protein